MATSLPPLPHLPPPHLPLPSGRCSRITAHSLRTKPLLCIAAAARSLIQRASSGSCRVTILRKSTVLTAARGNGGGPADEEGQNQNDLRTAREGDSNSSQTNYGSSEEGTKENKSRGTPAAIPLEIRWRDLLNPDPDNLVAVALTGLLALASVQALWQIFFISLAILLAALKYSFIAALLLFIVITLL